jgi:hypothetical protein
LIRTRRVYCQLIILSGITLSSNPSNHLPPNKKLKTQNKEISFESLIDTNWGLAFQVGGERELQMQDSHFSLLSTSTGSFKNLCCWTPVAHTCNHRYLEGKDQEDCGLRIAWANCSQDPISKNTQHKKGLVEWLKWQTNCLASLKP